MPDSSKNLTGILRVLNSNARSNWT